MIRVDGGWEYFVRLSGWCRDEGIEVWGESLLFMIVLLWYCVIII